MKIRCNICNKDFKPGNNPVNNLPNGMGFGLADGTMINICYTCLMYRHEAIDKYLDDLGIDTNGLI